ncbi:YbhB/YbcL family Raf kinase inhibitor-like protein [Nocardia sp. NPDC051052]|uniref:YbhB/YbcL family Raf kinase inhibitor-like protein n=1 Tax=Nocardia sp. NPDC051052 TaxID=3364322 RepID=UPI0037AC04BC
MSTISSRDQHLAWNHRATTTAPDSIALTSTAFAENGRIPTRHAGKIVGGSNVSPPLAWTGLPAEAVEVALIVEDPDAPLPRPFVHCVVIGIPADITGIQEGAISTRSTDTAPPFTVGKASMGLSGYVGPAPIDPRPHRYIFQLFALDQPTGLDDQVSKKLVLQAIHGHIVARGRLTGIYLHRRTP